MAQLISLSLLASAFTLPWWMAWGNFLAGRVTHHAGTPKPTSGANLQALKAQRREARQALARARLEANTMLAEHIDWALSCSST
ncbi:MAG: hypothetical protein EBX64_09880 [Betaproteobacteria bacterium]|nr:hypothetical protein [Betaproteobacteria bacterium]